MTASPAKGRGRQTTETKKRVRTPSQTARAKARRNQLAAERKQLAEDKRLRKNELQRQEYNSQKARQSKAPAKDSALPQHLLSTMDDEEKKKKYDQVFAHHLQKQNQDAQAEDSTLKLLDKMQDGLKLLDKMQDDRKQRNLSNTALLQSLTPSSSRAPAPAQKGSPLPVSNLGNLFDSSRSGTAAPAFDPVASPFGGASPAGYAFGVPGASAFGAPTAAPAASSFGVYPQFTPSAAFATAPVPAPAATLIDFSAPAPYNSGLDDWTANSTTPHGPPPQPRFSIGSTSPGAKRGPKDRMAAFHASRKPNGKENRASSTEKKRDEKKKAVLMTKRAHQPNPTQP